MGDQAGPKFTEGPWAWRTTILEGSSIDGDRLTNCRLGNARGVLIGVMDEVEKPNAEIIRLAPELIEVCRKLDKLDWRLGYEFGSAANNHLILDAALRMARDALAKIDGGKS